MTTPQERFIREEEFLRLFKKARKELDEGKIRNAVEYLEKAYSLSPDSEGVENLLGILYFRLEDYRKAEEIYIKLTRKNPKIFTLRTNLGLIYFKEKRYFDAIRELDKAVRLKPDYARAHNYLGLVYVELGKYRQAREEFLRAGSRTMAKKMENIIAGSMDADNIQKIYRSKEGMPAEQRDSQIPQFVLDSELQKILDEFEAGDMARTPSGPDGGNVEHIRLDLGKEGLMEASSQRKPIFTESKGKKLPEQKPHSTFKLGLTQKDTGFDAHNLLTIYFSGGTYSRVGGLIAAEGKHDFSPAKKRQKGRLVDEQLGGNSDPIMKIDGEGTLLLSSGDKRILILNLMSNDILYAMEDALFSFQSTVSWENGTINIGPNETVNLVQLSGEGNVALISGKTPNERDVSEGEPFRTKKNTIIGWRGRLNPKIIEQEQAGGNGKEDVYFIEFQGKGKVIFEKNA